MGALCTKSATTQDQCKAVADWKAKHSSSVRSSLIQRFKVKVGEDYELMMDKVLGKGGCGVVVVGRFMQTNHLYAVKICDTNKCDRARLEREVLLLKDVDHPNVIRLFRVYDNSYFMYFCMELCGEHIGKLLNSRKGKYIEEDWAKELCKQLLSAVRHLHERGIAHRDIKLQNILLDGELSRSSQIKLIDFGYGSRFIGCCPMRTVCGTPYTTAPEVYRESYDERCDVWSIGVVLFIMLSGKRPFESLENAGHLTDAGKALMMTNILAGRYSFMNDSWTNVSKEAKKFVKTLLNPRYLYRVQAKEALQKPWMQNNFDPDETSISSFVTQDDSFIRKRTEFDNEASLSPRVKAIASLNGSEDSAEVAVEESEIVNMKRSIVSSMQRQDTFHNENAQDAVENILKNHAESNGMRRTGNIAVAFGLHESQTTSIRNLFQTVDVDYSGSLSKDEFTQAMLILHDNKSGDSSKGELTPADCALIFDAMDVNRDDQITFTEFLAATLNPEVIDIEELSQAFKLLDVDNDGYISVEELKKMYSYKFMKRKYEESPKLPKLESSKSSSSDGVNEKITSDDSQKSTSAVDSMKKEQVKNNNEDNKNREKEEDEEEEEEKETNEGEEIDDSEEKVMEIPKIFMNLQGSNCDSLEDIVEGIIQSCDTDNDGRISYEEFIFAMTGAEEIMPRSYSTKDFEAKEGDREPYERGERGERDKTVMEETHTQSSSRRASLTPAARVLHQLERTKASHEGLDLSDISPKQSSTDTRQKEHEKEH